jgi:ankyrin repeat protein
MLLLENGADINGKTSNKKDIFYNALWRCNSDVCLKMIEKGADIHKGNGYIPLEAAIDTMNDNEDVILYMINHGVDVNIVDSRGDTLLHKAAFNSKLRTVKKLIEMGLPVNVKNNRNSTPLHCAALRGDMEICKMLCQVGAMVNDIDAWGRTPIYLACLDINKSLELITYLLGIGADPNTKANDGTTPLSIIRNYKASKNKEIEEILIRYGVTQ